MKLQRRLEWAEETMARAAQLAGVDESKGAYRLLSVAGRLLRHLGGRTSPVPLGSELAAMKDYTASGNIIVPGSMDFVVSDEVAVLSAFVARGSLVEGLDALLAGCRVSPGPSAMRVKIDISGWDGDRPASLALTADGFQPVTVQLE
jgi:hypothetical protein